MNAGFASFRALVNTSASDRTRTILRRIPAAEALAAIFFVATVDYSTRVNVGGSSLSAVLTSTLPLLFFAIIAMNLVIADSRLDRKSRTVFWAGVKGTPLFLLLFAAYAGARLLMSPTPEAIQNVMCYFTFVLSILLVVTSLRFDYRHVSRIMGWAAILSAGIYLIQQLFFTEGDVDRPLISDRAVAMTCLIGLAVFVPAQPGRAHPDSPPRSIAWPLFILVVLLNSLSRTALIVACVLLLFLSVRFRRSLRLPSVLGLLATVGAAAFLVATLYPPIMSRFAEGDNAQVGDVSVNTSGRNELWEITYTSAMQSPIWGNGPGDSKLVIRQQFLIPGTDHPHNDYLRMFNDLGIVGVALFWGGVLYLLIRLWRRARRLDEPRHWSAVMALLSVTLVGITDNIIVYQFIMLPVGVLVGISLRPDPGPASNAQLHGRWNWETRSGMLRLRFSTLLDRGPGLARLRGILGGMSDSAFSALSTFTVGLAAVRMLPDSGVALFSLMLTGYVIGQILPRNLVLTHIELSANRSATVYLPSMRDSLLRAKVPLGIAFVLTVASGFPAAGHVTFRQYLAMALGAGAASLSGAILTHMRASMHLVKLHEWAGTAALVNFMSTVAILVGGHLVLPARAVWALPFGALAGGQIAAMLVWRAAAARVSVRHAPPLTVLGSRLLYLVPIGAAQLMIYTQSTIILSALGTSASAHLEGARVAASPIYVVASGLGVLVIPPLVRGLASRTPAQTLAGLTRGMAILIGCGVAYAAALVGFGPAVSAVLGREIDTLLASVRAVAFSVDGTISMNLGILIALDEFARPAWLSTGTAVLGVCVTLLLVPSLGLYSVPVGQLLAVTTQLAVGIVITRGALRRRLGSTPTAS